MRSTTNKYATSLGKLVILYLAFFVALPLGAREINVPTQPVSPYADSEVSTNLVLNASRTDVKELKLNLQFNATPSNNFEVAFGRDSNTNCVLDVEEIETTYGWRGGKYFIENVTGWNRFEEDIIADGTNGVMDVTIEVEAEKWGDAIYKRLWHSGLKANFYNVDWRSDIGSPVNYQENVSNSFVVAQRIAPSIKAIANNKDTVIMAHSLGNMVVSSMIQDYELEVSKYIMVNSAVPVEAYDNNEVHRTQKLVHVEWENYPTNSWTTYWHTLFKDDTNDDRRLLTWKNRFSNVASVAINFYSSGDEVLSLNIDNDINIFTGISDSFAQYAWHKQELFKGINVPGGTDWSGWSMKRMLGEVLFSPLHVKNMSTEELKHTTVF